MPVNLLPIPASTSSPASDVPAPTSVIPGGCPGLSIALRFENYTVDTFGSAQVDAFCNSLKASTSWNQEISCAVTSVLKYPLLASVVVSAYVIFTPEKTDENLFADLITASFYRDLLLSNLNQSTLLPVIFSKLVSEVLPRLSSQLNALCILQSTLATSAQTLQLNAFSIVAVL